MATSQTKSSASSQQSNYSYNHSYSLDTLDGSSIAPPPLPHSDALALARRMREVLEPHIKDRKYRLKSYKSCFKNSHSLTWAVENIDRDKRIAVRRLNELIDWGLVSHVVDPTKRFKVNESRTLYFRFNEGALCQISNGDDAHISSAVNKNGESKSVEASTNNTLVASRMEAMQTKIDGLDHILEQTVTELNVANGRLEMMHQKVCTLVSQQITLFGVIILLSVSNIAPPSVTELNNYWPVQPTTFLAVFLMFMLGKCGLTFFNSWSLLDCAEIAPVEVVDEESTSADTTPSKIVTTEFKDKRPSFSKLVSDRFLMRRTTSKNLSIVKEVSVILSRESYSLPDVETWPHRPLLVCVNTPVSINLKVPTYGLGPCPLGKPFKFSSELFEGTCLIRIKDSNSDDTNADSEYFTGRKRIFQSVVQGRFKETLLVSDVLTGHEFTRPLKNLPHPWILKTASNFIGRVAPGSNVVVHTENPKVEAILAGTSQAVRGDEPGNEPNIQSRGIQEDCSIFGGTFTKDCSISRRKRILSNPEKARQYTYDTETIYTFEFYQNLFDANSYALDLGFAKIGCGKVLDGQPIQWLGKHRDGRYLWSFQIWHEKLLSE